jgi:hypothetical protein
VLPSLDDPEDAAPSLDDVSAAAGSLADDALDAAAACTLLAETVVAAAATGDVAGVPELSDDPVVLGAWVSNEVCELRSVGMDGAGAGVLPAVSRLTELGISLVAGDVTGAGSLGAGVPSPELLELVLPELSEVSAAGDPSDEPCATDATDPSGL